MYYIYNSADHSVLIYSLFIETDQNRFQMSWYSHECGRQPNKTSSTITNDFWTTKTHALCIIIALINVVDGVLISCLSSTEDLTLEISSVSGPMTTPMTIFHFSSPTPRITPPKHSRFVKWLFGVLLFLLLNLWTIKMTLLFILFAQMQFFHSYLLESHAGFENLSEEDQLKLKEDMLVEVNRWYTYPRSILTSFTHILPSICNFIDD